MPTYDRSLRLRIKDNLSDLIRTISPVNGFIDDLSDEDRVVRGRLFIGDDEPLPMVAINEPPMAIEPVKSSPRNPNSVGDWDILIQGWAEIGKIHATDNADNLAAQVRAVLASEQTKPSGRPGTGLGPDFLGFGPIIKNLRIGAPVVRPPDETSAKACFYLILTLEITEDMTKPFG